MANWHERIRAARKHGFTPEDLNDASNWVHCACGEQDPMIPRDTDNRPHDPQLAWEGVVFYNAVLGDDYVLAEATLRSIEKRALEVIAKQRTLEEQKAAQTESESTGEEEG